MAESKEFILKMAVDASGFESGVKAAEGFIKHLETVYKQVADDAARSGKKTEDSTKKIGDTAKKAAKDVEASFKTVGPTLDGFRKSLDNLSKGGFGSFTELNSALSLLGRGFSTVQSVATSAFEAIGDGSHFNNVERGFQSIQASVGLVADESLAKLRTAVGGTVSDLDLMERASKAVLLGLDPTKLDIMAEAAVKLGAAVGRNATEAFDDLVTGVGRGSALILDNLGIIVDTEAAYQKFADANKKLKSDLSDTEKNLAFQQAAFAAISEKAAALPPPIEDAGRAYERLLAVIANTKNDLSGAIASNTDLGATLNELSTTIRSVDPANVVAAAKAIGGAVGGIIDTVNDAAISLRFLFSDDAIAKGVRLQQKVNSFRKELNEKVNGEQSAYSKLVDGALSLVGVDRSRLQIAGNLIKAEEELANHIEGEQNRRSQARKDAEERVKLEKELLEYSRSLDKPKPTGSQGDPKEAAKAAKEAAKALESLIDKRDQLLAKAGTAGDLLGLKKAIASGDEAGIGQFAKKLRADSEAELRAGLADSLEKAGTAGGKVFAQIVAAETAIATRDALAQSAESITKAQSALLSQTLELSLDKALERGNLGEVQRIQRQLREASFKEQLDSERERLIAAGVDEAKAYEEARKVANANIALDDLARARQLEEAQKEAFRNSVDFFADILTPVFEEGSLNFEKIFRDAATRVAIGFSSQMLAAMTGLNFGSAQGLGESIAATFGFKGGGTKSFGELLGNSSVQLTSSAVALDTSAGLLSTAAVSLQQAAISQLPQNIPTGFFDGTTGNVGGFSFGMPAEGAPGAPATPEVVGASSTIVGGSSWLSSAIPFIASAAAAAVAYSNRGVLKGGDLNMAGQLALALPTAGLSFAYNPIKDALGFGGSRNKGEMDRRALRGLLQEILGEDLVFGGANGRQSLFDYGFNIDPSRPFGDSSGGRTYGDLVGLANPLSDIFVSQAVANGQISADDAKVLSEQLAGIFTNAIGESDNFNEALITAGSLMRSLDIDAEEAKKQLVDLFFAGDIDLPELGVDIRGLDQLSQMDLTGPTASLDALNTVLVNLDENRQVAAEGMILWFKEIEESSIVSFFTDQLGPGISESISAAVSDGSISMQEFAQIGLASGDEVKKFFTDRFGEEVGDAISSGLSDGALSFDELVEAGGLSTDKLIEDVRDKFGDKGAEAFATFVNAGLNSFEDLETGIDERNANIVELLFTTFTRYREGLEGVIAQNSGLDNQAQSVQRVRDGWRDAADEAERYKRIVSSTPPPPGGGGGGGSTDDGGEETLTTGRGKSRRVNLNRPLNPNAR